MYYWYCCLWYKWNHAISTIRLSNNRVENINKIILECHKKNIQLMSWWQIVKGQKTCEIINKSHEFRKQLGIREKRKP